MIFKLQHESELSGGLKQFAGYHQQAFDPVIMWWGLQIGISNNFAHVTDDAWC